MLASGRREGLREGLREGKHEHAVEMARKMLEDKLPIEKIAEDYHRKMCTGWKNNEYKAEFDSCTVQVFIHHLGN